MLEHGFHAVGINQLLSSVNVPKGSFYHWFKSKEDLGVELIRHYVGAENAAKRQKLQPKGNDENPITRLTAMFESAHTCFLENGAKYPCLLQKLSGEISNFSDDMRNELAKGFKEVISLFKLILDEAIEKNLLPPSTDTQAEAEFILDIWTGAQQRAALNRDNSPIQAAINTVHKRFTHPTGILATS